LKGMDKVILDSKSSNGVVPFFSLDGSRAPAPRPQSGEARPGVQQ
jgi:hypothetical protein